MKRSNTKNERLQTNHEIAKERGRLIAKEIFGEYGCIRYAFAIGAETEEDAVQSRRWLVGIASGWDRLNGFLVCDEVVVEC